MHFFLGDTWHWEGGPYFGQGFHSKVSGKSSSRLSKWNKYSKSAQKIIDFLNNLYTTWPKTTLQKNTMASTRLKNIFFCRLKKKTSYDGCGSSGLQGKSGLDFHWAVTCLAYWCSPFTLPPRVRWKMDVSPRLVSFRVIFHFYDYRRRGIVCPATVFFVCMF